MKVILSRKGFDSEFGRYPSPILPDGKLISLPIPSKKDIVSYDQLIVEGHKTYNDLMIELRMRVPCETCHLDPDLRREALPRDKNWKPLFGQINAAQQHLKKQRVQVGDLFLFFGWFKQTEYREGKIAFAQDAPDLHVIFGYMQIGKILKANSHADFEEWMHSHPHVRSEQRRRNKTNTLYFARDKLDFNQILPGASTVAFNEKLVLTKAGLSRSRWNLDPEIFRNTSITYHPEPWRKDYFQSSGRGQEFVIAENTKIETWAKDLINTSYG